MKDLIVSLFGYYEPVMSQTPVVVTDVESALSTVQVVDTVASGLAGVDWPWIAGVFLFAIVLWSFLRLVGVLLNG